MTIDAGSLPLSLRQRRDNVLYYFFIVQVISVTVLQKIGISLGDDAVAPLAIPLMLLGLAAVIFFVPPIIDSKRVALVALFLGAVLASTALSTRFSMASVVLLFALYAPFAITFQTSDTNYRRCMEFFSKTMVVMAGITIAQLFLELVGSWRMWPNLDELLPSSLLVPNFNYIQPIAWRSHLMKPNAVFFLEVSFLSQYLAIALAVEIVLFQRLWRIILFTAVLFATFAGTGLLLLALTLPVLLGRLDMKYMTMIIIGLVLVGVLALEVGWLDVVAHRIGEYRYSGSSANMRFVAPLDRLIDFMARGPQSIYSGIGAGQIEKANDFQWWPITKAVVEYGAITGILLYVLIFYVLMDRVPYRRIGYLMIVWFSIEGALLTAVNPYTCALFCSLFVLERGPRRIRRTTTATAEGESPASGRRRRGGQRGGRVRTAGAR